jgi:hypothetical protein
MYAASVEPGRVTLVLSVNEVRLLNNALNEVLNGVAIPVASFASRLGGTRDEVDHLLMSVHAILDSAEVVQPKDV